jgi:hypothetical protein
VQSIIGETVLKTQLVSFGLLPKEAPTLTSYEEGHLEKVFRKSELHSAANSKLLSHISSVWHDNANSLSMAYTGSLALKSDFTRYIFRKGPSRKLHSILVKVRRTKLLGAVL